MSDYFNPNEACPKSKELLYHSAITTVRCGRCTLLNPNYKSPDNKQQARERTAPLLERVIIDIDDSPANPKPIESPQGLLPAVRRGLATQIPSLPSDFKVGNAEKERQLINQRLYDRKTKTAFIASIPTVHFAVGVAHWENDDLADEGRRWIAASSQWTIDENNRELTSDDLVASLLQQASKQSKRDELKKWLHCEGGDWSLGHTNPTKGGSREVAIWDQHRVLSVVIESGAYEQKPIPGSTRKLVSVWLYWRPEPPPDVPTPTPTPRRPAKKGGKKEKGVKAEPKVKDEPKIKAEPKVKAEPLSKRPRPASGEVSTPKRFTVTRQRVRDLGEGLFEEEDLEDLLPFEEMLKD